MVRREVPLDAARILQALAAHEVDYVLIGGLAVQAHGHVRTTQDVDILPAPATDNLDRLGAALRGLDARPAGTRARPRRFRLDAAAIEAAGTLALDTDAGAVDVHTAPPGADAYLRLRERALEINLAAVRVAVAGRDDLIAMKRASGRPLDRGDVIALTQPERSGEDR